MTEPLKENRFEPGRESLGAIGDFESWNPEAVEVLNDLLRALRRKKGFGLFFVQCSPAQGQRVITAIRERFPKKRLELFELNRESETLYEELLEQHQAEPFEIACVTGVEQALYDYEDTKRLAGWSSEEIYNYSWKGLPPLLGHLNRQREAFEADLPIALVFLVPSFVIDYFVQRAPDFFDWRSGFFKLTENLKDLQKVSQELLGKTYEEYLDLNSEQRVEKILEIKHIILQLDLSDVEEKSSLLQEQGRLFQSNGDFGKALDCCDRAIAWNSKNYEAWNIKGNLLHDLQRYEEALKSYNSALEINPSYQISLRNRGDTLSKMGKHEEAIKSYDRALENHRDFAACWNNRGIALHNLQKYEEAIKSYENAIKIQPDLYYSWYNKGALFATLNRFEEALGAFNYALTIKEDSDFIWLGRGDVLQRLGILEEAIFSYQKSLEFNPKCYIAWMQIANIFKKKKKYDEALESLSKALKIQPKFIEAWIMKARLMESLGHYSEVLNIYRKIEKLSPQSFWNYLYQALGLYYSGEYAAAIKSFDAAVQLAKLEIDKKHLWHGTLLGITIQFNSNPSYFAFYGRSISFYKLRYYKKFFADLKRVFLSVNLYVDIARVLRTVIFSAFKGKLQYRELSNDFFMILRGLGFRR